jgi:predicted RNA-binding Zn-ribbon protein involved in translation (DUF1610 family)
MRDRVKTCPNCGCRQSHENYVCEECGYPETVLEAEESDDD